MIVLRVERITPYAGTGSLRGWCHVIVSGGMRIKGVSVHRKPGRIFARLPKVPRFGRDGRQARHEPSGAVVYDTPAAFETPEDQKRFSDAVIDLVRAQCPDLLA